MRCELLFDFTDVEVNFAPFRRKLIHLYRQEKLHLIVMCCWKKNRKCLTNNGFISKINVVSQAN